jgi:hypothetical protein
MGWQLDALLYKCVAGVASAAKRHRINVEKKSAD